MSTGTALQPSQDDPRIEGNKQLVRVLEAVQEGCLTSREVANFTGLPLHHVSAHMSELVKGGCIKKTGEVRYQKVGRTSNTYRALI